MFWSGVRGKVSIWLILMTKYHSILQSGGAILHPHQQCIEFQMPHILVHTLYWYGCFLFFSCPNPSSNRCVLVTQLCLTLCNRIDCSLPGSSAHGILQARILEWVSMSFSRKSSQPRDWTWVSCIAGRFFIIWAIKEALSNRYIVWSHCNFILHLLNDW